jgi:hypothetical protein
MPQVLTKHPEIVLRVIDRAEGATCGENAGPPKILKDCPIERFCRLPRGELCVYGLDDINKLSQFSCQSCSGQSAGSKKNSNKKGLVIEVGGIQGAGKSYLCKKLNKLKNVVCIDMDDILQKAYHKVKDKRSFVYAHRRGKREIDLINEKHKIRDSLIKKYRNKILVFSGTTLHIHKPDIRLFMKITDLDKAYRRTMKREVSKFCDNKKLINMILKNEEDPHLIEPSIAFRIMYAIGLITFRDYKELYKRQLKIAKKLRYHIMTQDEIHRFIKHLATPKTSAVLLKKRKN